MDLTPGKVFPLLLAVAILTGSPGRSTAAEPVERETARGKLVEGVALLDQGDFAAALARFEEAYRIHPSPKILYNIGLALKGLGRYAQAFAVFERFSREVTDATPEHLGYSQQELERLAKRVAFVEVSSDVAEAEVLLDGRSLGKLPIPRRLPVDTGAHELVLRVPLGAISRRFTAEAGQVLELEIKLASRAAPPSAPAAQVAAAPVRPAAGPPREAPTRSRAFDLAVEGGLRLPRFAARSPARSIEAPVLGLARLSAAYLVPAGRATLQLGLGGSFTRLPYAHVQTGAEQVSRLLGALITVGLSYPLAARLSLAGALEAGVVWWAGLEDGDPFTRDHAGATGPIPMPTLALGLALEQALSRDLFLRARVSYEVSWTTSRGLTASIARVGSLGLVLGAGARF